MQFSGEVMTPAEAEMLIRELKSFTLEEVGSQKWKDQREKIERLNMCSHSNAVLKKDDYVKSYLIEHERLPDLLHELLACEVWRQRVLPQITDAIASNPSATYMYCHYEVVLLNLLECICYYEEVVVALGDDVVELIDYCWRQVYRLFSESDVNAVEPVLSAREISSETPKEHLSRQLHQLMFTRALTCLSLLWFVIDRLNELPLSVTNTVLIKNDLLVGLSEILLLQPWMRKSKEVILKYYNGAFHEVHGDEVMRVCVPEAHTWFCLHKLLCDPQCRNKYQYTKSKKEIILRVRRFLNDTLVDQIPALESVQRALEELSFLEPPSGTEEKFKSMLVIEQVPRIMSSLDKPQTNWSELAKRLEHKLRDPAERAADAMRLARVFDQMLEQQL